jgi:hypothetical protein
MKLEINKKEDGFECHQIHKDEFPCDVLYINKHADLQFSSG